MTITRVHICNHNRHILWTVEIRSEDERWIKRKFPDVRFSDYVRRS